MIRVSVSQLLRKVSPTVVPFAVSSGEEAVEEVRARGPGYYHVALVDYNMGGGRMDGAATVTELIKLDPSLRCIGATGNGNESGVKSAYQVAGAVGVCAKPFGVDQLRSLIEKQPPAPPPVEEPPKDWAEECRATLNELDLETTAFKECLEELKEDVTELSANPEDWKVAHKLKGQSLFFALRPLIEVTSSLEEAGRQGKECDVYVEALTDAWEEVSAVLG
jgi:CheY-like chemotaxis protein